MRKLLQYIVNTSFFFVNSDGEGCYSSKNSLRVGQKHSPALRTFPNANYHLGFMRLFNDSQSYICRQSTNLDKVLQHFSFLDESSTICSFSKVTAVKKPENNSYNIAPLRFLFSFFYPEDKVQWHKNIYLSRWPLFYLTGTFHGSSLDLL